MRQAYFTEATIDAKSLSMLNEIQHVVKVKHMDLVPARSALLILDMQDYFLKDTSHAFIPSAKAIILRIQALASAYITAGLPVIMTRHVNTLGDAGMMGLWWRDLITEDDPLSAICSELRIHGARVIHKSSYDAFYCTSLQDVLSSAGVNSIVVCGVMTHLCCETTARSGFVRGFRVFLPVDATATYNEAFHLASLLNLAHGFAFPVRTDDVVRQVSQ